MKRLIDVIVVIEKEVVEEVKVIGIDVISKVEVEEGSEIVGYNNKEINVVNFYNVERVILKYKWKFEDGIKLGDYFDFILSNNVEIYGILFFCKVLDIKSKDDNILVVGKVMDERKIRYMFIDYINNKNNLMVELNLNLFIDLIIVMK